MDISVLNNGAPFSYTNFGSSDGSQAQAPVFPNDDEIPVTQGPGPEVWETHRPMIKGLYLDEDKRLKDVMTIMQRDYGIKATVKMYKSRVNKWGLDKNCKANEMKAIARKKVERDAIGKASLFKIRGRQIEIEEVLRHFKRKSYHSLEELVVREGFPRSETPSNIEVSTPRMSTPSPSSHDAHAIDSAPMTVTEAEVIRSQDPSQLIPRSYEHKTDTTHLSSDFIRRQSLWMQNNLRRLSSLGRISPTLDPPRDLLVSERLFAAIRTFIQSSWDRGVWSTHKNGHLTSGKTALGSTVAIIHFEWYCYTVTSLLERKLFVEARQLLCKACERCKDVVEEEHPDTLSIIFEVYIGLAQAGYSDAAIKVFQHLKARAMMTPLSTLAFRQFIENFLLVNQNTEEVYTIAWKCSDDNFEQRLDPFHRTWLNSRLGYIMRMSSRIGSPEAEILLRSLLTQCEQFCGRSDLRCFAILESLAWILYDQDKFQEAEEVGQRILQWAEIFQDEGIGAFWTMKALEMVSAAQYSQDKDDQAKNSLERCIDMAARRYGEQHPVFIGYLLRLEEWLLSWGRQEEARALAEQRARILGPAEIKELIE